MRTSPSAIGTAIVVAIGAQSCGPAPAPHDLQARAQASHVRQVLGLTYPYRVIKMGQYLDGGSTGVLVRDRWGRRLRFFFKVPQPNTVPSDTSSADTLRMAPRFFWSGGDEQMRGARRLPIGGPEELAILDMLDVISLDYLSRPVRDSLIATVREHRWKEDVPGDQQTALRAALLASARNRDPRGTVVWIRGKGWQI